MSYHNSFFLCPAVFLRLFPSLYFFAIWYIFKLSQRDISTDWYHTSQFEEITIPFSTHLPSSLACLQDAQYTKQLDCFHCISQVTVTWSSTFLSIGDILYPFAAYPFDKEELISFKTKVKKQITITRARCVPGLQTFYHPPQAPLLPGCFLELPGSTGDKQ